MRINAVNNNPKLNTCFKMRIIPSESVKYAVLTSHDLMRPLYKEQNKDFVREFSNSLARILKSNQADSIWATVCRGYNNLVAPSYVKEQYNSCDAKEVLRLDSIQKNEHKYGHMMYSQEGGNMMRTLIEYAKTIKDIPEQNLDLTDEELENYAFENLKDELQNSIGGFYYIY